MRLDHSASAGPTTPARSSLFAAFLLSLIAAYPLAAQARSDADPAHVLVLGTYHFANPGRDVVKTEAPDVLSAVKQAEVDAVVEGTRRFCGS